MSCSCFECGGCSGGTPCGCVCAHETGSCWSMKPGVGISCPMAFTLPDIPTWLALERVSSVIGVPMRAVGGALTRPAPDEIKFINPLQIIQLLSEKGESVLVEGRAGLVVGPTDVLQSEHVRAEWFSGTRGNNIDRRPTPGVFSMSTEGTQRGGLLLHVAASLNLNIVLDVHATDWSEEVTTEIKEADAQLLTMHALGASRDEISTRDDHSILWRP